MTQFDDEIKMLQAMAKSYAERHQIIYSDTHERQVSMIIEETIKLIGNKVLNLNKDDKAD
jgi:hypothetical protein